MGGSSILPYVPFYPILAVAGWVDSVPAAASIPRTSTVFWCPPPTTGITLAFLPSFILNLCQFDPFS